MKKRTEQQHAGVVMYQTKSGSIQLRTDATKETILANQLQIGELFGVDVRTINEHIKNIYRTKELMEKSTIRKIRIVQKEGKREVLREVNHYSLDVIIAVGYRVNSKSATQFRIWATKILSEFMVSGYVVNRSVIAHHYDQFMKIVSDIQTLLPEHVALDPKTILELVKEFSSTWMSLDAYDKEALVPIGKTKKAVALSAEELLGAIAELRSALIAKSEATELFAQERHKGSVEGIIGNVMQSFGGASVYRTAEEKAAHLLYFMVKNHPFVDGNKRSGAFAFIWFLRKANIKARRNINPAALTALTLLIAESKPEKKEQMTALVTTFLN